jgi:hypothetical protein
LLSSFDSNKRKESNRIKKATATTLSSPSLLCYKKKKGIGNVVAVAFFVP